MKILHILGNGRIHRDPDSAALSGVVRATLEYAKHQAALGHEVQVIGFDEQNISFSWHGVKIVAVKEFGWAKFRLGNRRLDFGRHFPLVLYTLTNKFDVVHSHMHPYLRWISGRLKVAHMHVTPQADSDNILLPSTKDSLVQLDRYANIVIAVSRFVEDQLRGHIQQHKLRFIYNGGGFTSEECDKSLEIRYEFRQRHNISMSDILIMYAGAFVPDKGIHHLANAFLKTASKYPYTHLALIGGGLWGNTQIPNAKDKEYIDSVEEALASLPNRAHFLGLVQSKQMIDIYTAADILVVPSVWREAFGITALEGLSVALPVIASHSGGLVELVGEHRGLLVPPGDEQALTEALEQLITNPEQRKIFGERGQAYARQPQFTWEQAARQSIALYEDYLGGQQ